MKKLLSLQLPLLLLSFFTVCCNDNTLRNTIHFREPVEFVQDSIAIMNTLLNKLPEPNNEIGISNYFFDNNDNLCVNSIKLGLLTSGNDTTILRSTDAFKNFTDVEKLQFISIAKFLKNNFIEGSSKSRQIGEFLFDYRTTAENEYQDIRNIILIPNEAISIGDTIYKNSRLPEKVLDKKGKLLLTVPIDVEID